jgi:hypothetical protein
MSRWVMPVLFLMLIALPGVWLRSRRRGAPIGPPKHPAEPGPLRLRVMADYGASGIWQIGPYAPFRHAMVPVDSLGLGSELAERFRAWIERYDGIAEPAFDLMAFNAEGRDLARQLKAALGDRIASVEFSSAAAGGGVGLEEEI